MQMLQRVAADAVACAVADHEEFGGGNAATFFFRHQDLGVHGGDGHGEVLADGILALGREGIGDAGNGGGDVGGVERGKNEMAGFCGGDGDAHGFGVAHFVDDDDVGGRAESGTQGGREIGSVGADFNLLDDAAYVVVLELDGIFDD